MSYVRFSQSILCRQKRSESAERSQGNESAPGRASQVRVVRSIKGGACTPFNTGIG
jgi:hypothetical protein